MPTKVEKWQALASSFMTQTSFPLAWKKNHPDEETHPKTTIANIWKNKKVRFP
jgi:hypothetical protein